jgi:hypothetical protein
MRRLIASVLLAVLAVWQASAQAQARSYSQAELDALLAPVALYPDPLLSNILVAATYPDDLRDAAAWSRSNPHLTGDAAVRAADSLPWHPGVKALLAFPELLARMDESPQWTADLGAAFLDQEPHVMDTVQGLRRRAQASGSLQSNDQYSVQQHGQAIAVYPVQPQVIYVPYYNPYVVYGPWWWHSYRPVYWRPWHPRPAVFVSASFFSSSVDWHRRHVNTVRHVHVQRQHVRRAHRAVQPIVQGARIQPAPCQAAPRAHQREQRSEGRRERRSDASAPVTIHNHAHPVQPIVQGARIQPGTLQAPRAHQQEHRPEVRREFHHRAPERNHSAPRGAHRRESRQESRQQQRRG